MSIAYRISRISIPYFPILLILFVFIGYGGTQFNGWATQFNDGKIDVSNLVAHILYISPYNLKWQNTIIGVEWTLGIEVFYYVLFGVLIRLKLLLLNWRSFAIFLAIFLLLGLSQRFLTKFLEIDGLFIHWSPMGYGYMFLLGGLAYYLRTIMATQSDLKVSKLLLSDVHLVLIVATFAVLPIILRLLSIGMAEAYFVLGTFLVISLFQNKSSLAPILNNRVLTFFGSISYSFYLIHYIVLFAIPKVGQPVLDFVVGFLLATAVSFAWYYVFERIAYTKVKASIKNI